MPPSVKAEFARNPIASIVALIGGFCSISTLLVGLFLAAQWTQRVEGQIAQNITHDREHHNNPSLHMSYEHKVEKFVTRTEWIESAHSLQRQIEDMKAAQVRQEAKLDKILDKVIEQNK